MQHTFEDPILLTHFIKNAPSPGANHLIDLLEDVFLDTEEELNLIIATMWCLAIKYDMLDEKEKPKNRDEGKKVSRVTVARAGANGVGVGSG
jgi:hypothetical protein